MLYFWKKHLKVFHLTKKIVPINLTLIRIKIYVTAEFSDNRSSRFCLKSFNK